MPRVLEARLMSRSRYRPSMLAGRRVAPIDLLPPGANATPMSSAGRPSGIVPAPCAMPPPVSSPAAVASICESEGSMEDSVNHRRPPLELFTPSNEQLALRDANCGGSNPRRNHRRSAPESAVVEYLVWERLVGRTVGVLGHRRGPREAVGSTSRRRPTRPTADAAGERAARQSCDEGVRSFY